MDIAVHIHSITSQIGYHYLHITHPLHYSSPYPNARAGLHGRSSERTLHKCGWRTTDVSICGGTISGATVSQHLVQHGITNMSFDAPVRCRWCPDGKKLMNRKSILRHVHEVHLRLERPSKSRASSSALTSSRFVFHE
ncbi:hypothetical protein PAXRUDRAFT_171007 [Paxillus rubicundulus Ve08.2h10]|uniref:Uncharacterized protein n=1 Tax=Paxillus rubicundulus Ve08.2h10 TaxID=930991 RepID=A0A0D0CXZ1_9AGAM|nr:hypothetical protein PAXRUDRAFT_171007 [Paxillus rubicundulus Ve08.2h10]